MFEFAAVFSDHMVLCRRKEIRLFGVGDDGAVLSAELCGHSARCTVRDGRFTLLLPPMEAARDCVLTVTDGQTAVRFTDVAIGDVYLAGGQSNMELELQNAKDGAEFIAQTNDIDLRFYNVPKVDYWTEESAAAERRTSWRLASGDSLRDVSAVAFHFARRLRLALGVPVGIIDCYWGGTSASCWMDDTALSRTSAGQYYLADYMQRVGGKTHAQFDEEQADYDRRLAEWNDTVARLQHETPGIEWSLVSQQAGEYPWPPPDGYRAFRRPAGLAKTMLARVVPYTLTGALFYQGEDDIGRHQYYEALLTSMIQRWREWFMDAELPFLFAQLPMYGDITVAAWAEQRLAQWRVYRKLRRTGLAVLIDLGEKDNIHPTDKQPVGDRLCEQALEVVYGRKGEGSPYAVSKHTDGHTLCVRLSAPVIEQDGKVDLLEIAGVDGQYHPADAVLDGDTLRLSSAQVAHPVMARYAHVNYAVVHLFGQNGLPLAPFELIG